MTPLRTSAAARLLSRSTSLTPSSLVTRRLQSSLTPAQPAVPAIRQNNPDYKVQADKATSTFTPVPKRIQDASEETDTLPASVISGAPIELQARQVRIYKESKPATQSGTWKGHHWRDMMQGTRIFFESKEDAIKFAEKQGYEYFVQEPNTRAFTPKVYANNFAYSPGKLKHVRTK